jgi:hypothetical protein
MSDEIKSKINSWRKRIERIQKRGRESVNNPEDKSDGLYAWLDLDDIIQEMDYFVTH